MNKRIAQIERIFARHSLKVHIGKVMREAFAKDIIALPIIGERLVFEEDDEIAGLYHCDCGAVHYEIFSMISGKFSASVNACQIDLPCKILDEAIDLCCEHALPTARWLLGGRL